MYRFSSRQVMGEMFNVETEEQARCGGKALCRGTVVGGAWEKGCSSGWGMVEGLQAWMGQWIGHGGKVPRRPWFHLRPFCFHFLTSKQLMIHCLPTSP